MGDDKQPEDLFSPRTRTRTGDPDTSHAAAEYIAPKMTAKRLAVLLHFARYKAMTDLELQEAFNDPRRSTYRTRRSELVTLKLVEDSGLRKIQQDTKRIVWIITPAGLAAARALQ
jgi:hypothetical protein